MQLTQVSGAARPGWGSQGQEMYVGPVRNLGVIGGEPQPSGRRVPLQQRLEADLEDVRLPSIQRLDAINIDVNPDYLMAEFRHACGVGSTQIVRADDAHLQCHSQIFPQHAANRSQQPPWDRRSVATGLRGGIEHQVGQLSVAQRFRCGLDADFGVASAFGHVSRRRVTPRATNDE